METINCIFCNQPSSYVAIRENGFDGVKCHNCDLIYISPRPTSSEVAEIYTDGHAALYADAQFHFERFTRKLAARTVSKIKKYRKAGALLELGPGGGSFLVEARAEGFEPYGIELNPIEAQWINEKLRIQCESTPLNEKSFSGKKFDVICHRDVLSHLYDPITVFKDINRALNRNGLLVFETGNIADVRESSYKWFTQFLYPDHLFFFGEKSLNLLLRESGFKPFHVYREVVLLQLFLAKALWGIKESLKDKDVVEAMKSKAPVASERHGMSLGRRFRLLYRYVSYYFVRAGTFLPKKGTPMKLLVVAEKERSL